jgi:uncharacterized protein YecA (UPF0149 family)
MGAIAEAIAAFAQPLLDQTDGSPEEMNKAFEISQVCFNLALLSEDRREAVLSELRPSLEMDDEEYGEFRRGVIDPMVRRHHEMFPNLHSGLPEALRRIGASLQAPVRTVSPAKTDAKPDRYGPCPCNSGRKYKFCCGAKGR